MPATSGRAREVRAAGAVVLGREETVLLVHRPKYDDWSFPKGKLDRGEHATAAAVREVEEETGVRVRLGVPLPGQRYAVRDGVKTVRYWVGRAIGPHDVGRYRPNDEIDEVTWVPADKARLVLSYRHDVEVLEAALEQRKKTRALVVLRHGQARSRRAWRADDRRRPLLVTGGRQAERLTPVLAAYDARRLVTSGSTRCVQTLEPYAAASGRRLRRESVLSEEGATRRGVRRLVEELVEELEERPAKDGTLVVCSHRPVLPWVFDALGLEDAELAPGEMVVVHQRKGTVRAVERHLVR
jgi:8-oxo-(d)GTP phosphatase